MIRSFVETETPFFARGRCEPMTGGSVPEGRTNADLEGPASHDRSGRWGMGFEILMSVLAGDSPPVHGARKRPRGKKGVSVFDEGSDHRDDVPRPLA